MRYVWQGGMLADTQADHSPNRIWMEWDGRAFSIWDPENQITGWSDPIPIPEGLNELEAKAYALATWRMRT